MFKEKLNYWNTKQAVIKNNIVSSMENKKILIEVAAQHPLKDGKEPGVEFESRLLRAIEIYKKEIEKGNEVIFYIPGSVHCITNKDGEKVSDTVSLAYAGKQYLINYGIPSEIIRADDANEKYKGDNGVYNSGDECYVSTQIYKNEGCNRLISVVSPVQVFRKGMFYNQFGVQPEIHSVPLDNTFHNYVGEIFWSLYITTFLDYDWQGEKSFLSVLTRVERCLGYKCNEVEENTLKNKKIVIPKQILDIKQELLEKYNIAKANMQNNSNNTSTLVELVISDDNFKQEIERAIELCNMQKEQEKRVVVAISTRENAMRFYSELYKQKIEGIEIKITEDISKEFKERQYGTYYCVCPSDQVMKKSIESIEDGVIPLIYAVPSQNDNYIKETFELFDDIIGRDIIDLSDKPNVEIVRRENVIKGLMNQMDPESLVDLSDEVIEWIDSYTEGEKILDDREER